MLKIHRIAAIGLLLLGGATACADLEVNNPNDPDRDRALSNAADVEALIAGSYEQWWRGQQQVGSTEGTPAFILSQMSFQHGAWPANFGQVEYSWIPRRALVNAEANQFYPFLIWSWNQNYKAIYAVATGLRALEDSRIRGELGEEKYKRARAYGKFVQGLAHASLAILYDSAFVVDETTEIADENGQPIPQAPQGYRGVMSAAMEYFDEAIALAEAGFSENIPASWMSKEVTAEELAKLIYSLKARYHVLNARTPEERAAVDWENDVLANLDKGLTDSWTMKLTIVGTQPWTNHPLWYWGAGAWQQLSYMILGMADQSGMYQKWLAKPVGERNHTIDGERFLIVTPDKRFAQGTTVEEQMENPGTLYVIPDPDVHSVDVSENWGQPARGTWRWTWYFMTEPWSVDAKSVDWPEFSKAEMDLLRAEGYYRRGDRAAAAEIINRTRVAAGLNPTDENGTNTDCVPKLPNGECGDLFEMLKWEKRIETQFKGPYVAPWYFDGRGWGDLYEGTPLEFPMPCHERNIMGVPCYTFGGVGNPSTAPKSVYNWPHEG